jgi:RimJ/RimL family protein N-acetyltransferase
MVAASEVRTSPVPPDGGALSRRFTDGAWFTTHRQGDTLVTSRNGDPVLTGTVDTTGGLAFRPHDERRPGPYRFPAWTTTLEALGIAFPTADSARLHVADPETVRTLAPSGLAVRDGDGWRAHGGMLWQQAHLWQPQAGAPYPSRHVMTGERRHPLRPPEPSGDVYTRFIPWLGQQLVLRTVDLDRDLPAFHRWMNDPFVAEFWGEQGDLDTHRGYLARLQADPHMTPLVMSLDGHAFGYFEVYWAKENRIAPFYDVDDHDRGWHVLIGEASHRGKAHAAAWLTSIAHHLFLDDPRTRRIVGEPRSDHHRQIANLEKTGYAKLKEFDFPHKRAMLVSLERERFFGERLYLPRPEAGLLPLPSTP